MQNKNCGFWLSDHQLADRLSDTHNKLNSTHRVDVTSHELSAFSFKFGLEQQR